MALPESPQPTYLPLALPSIPIAYYEPSSPGAYNPRLRQPHTLGEFGEWLHCLEASRFINRADPPIALDPQLPGLAVLQAYAEAEFGTLYSAENFRRIRGRVALTRHLSLEEANAVSLAEVAAVLVPGATETRMKWLTDICPCPKCDQMDHWVRPDSPFNMSLLPRTP
jgi:hypothetical protein